MSEIEDGGAAFPRSATSDGNEQLSTEQDGMTLRDYFAAKAMNALIDGYDYEVREKSIHKADRTGFDDRPHKDGSSDATFASQLAEESYIIADAMIVARKR